MGVMRFRVHPASIISESPEIYRAYISGFDGRVFPTRIEVDGEVIACRRPVSDSGKLHIAWPVEGFGHPVLTTSSLPEREQPYFLPVELARGTISQIRDQYSGWELQGMSIPPEFFPVHYDAQRAFGKAVALQETPAESAKMAAQAISLAHRASETLMRSYTDQRMGMLSRRSRLPPSFLGCRLEQMFPTPSEQELFRGAFSAASVPIEWRLIEPSEGTYHWDLPDTQVRWCEEQKLFAIGGPLIDLSSEGLPNWLWQWDQDVLNLQSFLCDFVETAITRYFGTIRTWEVATRGNTGGAMTLSEEDRLSLVAKALEVARRVDEEIQLLITVDQPWGEYQARGHHRLSPFQFVDALLRSGVGLSGVNLEIGVGYRPRGSAPRDRLALSQLIDRWGTLGIPVFVTVAFPSSAEHDSTAEGDLEVPAENLWKQEWSEVAQAEWLREFLPALMAKQPLVGIFWSHFSDAAAHHFPHGGMLDANGREKPALRVLREFQAS